MTADGPVSSGSYWAAVWGRRQPDELSWYQAEPRLSIEMITRISGEHDAVVDVGGGASVLVDRLLDAGYTDLTVIDIAAPAVALAKKRLAGRAQSVSWLVGDVTDFDFGRRFDVWHDRAVLHFLTSDADRERYVGVMLGSVRSGGHVVLATFGPAGPTTCSGLPVRRYDESAMAALSRELEPVDFVTETHRTPAGASQQFLYGLFRRA